jgi:NADH:ubiquinone oxidoreductase subunit E
MNRSEIIGKYKPIRENLLLILHELQNNNPEQYISEEDMTEVADFLNITYSSVYGVVTYYSMFSLAPRGKFIIRVCNSQVCDMTGSEDIMDELKKLIGIKPGETSPDRLFSLESAECLGHCDESPAMIINDKFFGNLTRLIVRNIIEKLRSGAE